MWYEYLTIIFYVGLCLLGLYLFWKVRLESEYDKECKKPMYYRFKTMFKDGKEKIVHYKHEQLKHAVESLKEKDILYNDIKYVHLDKEPETLFK